MYLAEIGLLAGAGEELEVDALRTMVRFDEWCSWRDWMMLPAVGC